MATPDLVNLGYFLITLIVGVVVAIYGQDIRAAFSKNYKSSVEKTIAKLERLEANPSAMAAECTYRVLMGLAFVIVLCTWFLLMGQYDQLGFISSVIMLARFGSDLDIRKNWWFLEGWWTLGVPLVVTCFLVSGFAVNAVMLHQYKNIEKAKQQLKKKIDRYESRIKPSAT
jgi:hypothetical protein